MPAPLTCTVSGVLYGPNAAPLEGAKVKVFVTSAFTDQDGNYIAAGLHAATESDADGEWSLAVVQTQTLGHSVTFQFEYPLGNNQSANVKYAAVIPDQSTADFADLVDLSTGSSIIAADPTTDLLTEGVVNLYFTEARAQAAISGLAPVDVTSGVVSMPAASALQDGYLTKEDYAAFSAASSPVTSVNGQTGVVVLDSDDIDEGVANLYYTDVRAAAAAPVQSVNSATGAVVLDSDDISEGSSNKYFTDNRALAALGLTTKGDILVKTTSGYTNVGVGSNGQVLTADSAQTPGVKWADPSGAVDSVNGQTGVVVLDAQDVLPDQTGNAGKVLTTDGSTATWQNTSNAVTSVNSQTGAVVLDTDDIAEGATNKYYTDTRVDTYIDTLAGANNGLATLDSGGKVPTSQLPNSIMEYKGTWAASTNTPTLSNGSGDAGDVYIASDAGTVNFGAGNITFAAGDWAVYSGTVWQKSINSNAVASVNGQTGAVSLAAADVGAQPSDSDLTALAALSSTGLIARTGSGTAAVRTIIAGSSKISVSNGDGVSANPSIDVAEANLSVFTGDSGSGGVKGVVPAPASGDAAANKYLKANGTWATVSAGSIDINGLTTVTPTEFDFAAIADSSDSGNPKKSLVGAVLALFKGYINGLELSNNGSDANNDIDIAAGCAVAADQSDLLVLSSTLTKRLDASWAVGSGNGGLDTGTEASNTWYWVWLIKRSDTGVVDALFSTSASSPTMPANYDRKRRIGAIRNSNTSDIIAFYQYGDIFLWKTPAQNISTTISTATTTGTVTVPPARCLAYIVASISKSSATPYLFIKSPDQTAFSSSNAQTQAVVSGGNAFAPFWVPTNASSQIDFKSSESGVTLTVDIHGYQLDRTTL